MSKFTALLRQVVGKSNNLVKFIQASNGLEQNITLVEQITKECELIINNKKDQILILSEIDNVDWKIIKNFLEDCMKEDCFELFYTGNYEPSELFENYYRQIFCTGIEDLRRIFKLGESILEK